jgi:DNA-binding transcriptional LysR family regulator
MGRNDRYKDIQLTQLRSFCLAATSGNFTAAAKALGLSAPTVWQQVRALERRLRTTLMRRRGRNVELTPEGRSLLELVQPHVSGLDSLEPLFAARQEQLPQQLIVSSIPYLISSHLVRPVREFSARHPAVRLKLHVCVWFEEVARMVEQGQADLGVLFYDRDALRSPQLEYERLCDLRFALLMPAKHPLARKRSVTPQDVAPYPLIVPPEGSYARRSFEQFLRRHNLAEQVHVVMETALLDIIKKYVAAGVGLAFVHLAEEKEPMANVQVRYFDNQPENLSVATVVRKGAHRSELTQEFQRTLERLLGRPAKQGGN